MKREISYASAGVNRELRAESKKMLHVLTKTYGFSRTGGIVHLPYGNVFPIDKDRYLDLTIEGVGTKVLVAQLAEKYDTIGIDGVAMAVNDVIRSGAKPLALADNIHTQLSDPILVKEWLNGITRGAVEAECVVPSGEIGDVPELVKGLNEGKGFDLIVASIGEVKKEKLILGRGLRLGDRIIGLRSSGLHSNGISLARKILFKQWGGKYESHDIPDYLDRELVLEVLEPTKIYVKSLRSLAENVRIKAAVHITGDAYAKFYNLARFSKGAGFVFDKFDPHPIFGLLKKTAGELGYELGDEEMFRTFNMGWGFAVVVNKKDEERTIDLLGKTVRAECIGQVTKNGKVEVRFKKKRIVLK